jgi:DNA-binding SARP family transcriptional activator
VQPSAVEARLSGLEVRVLGPLEVRADGVVLALGGVARRTLLARLLLDVNEEVTVACLLEDLWGGNTPQDARHTLEAQVSALRRTLRGHVATRSLGYSLELDPRSIDAVRFQLLLREARDAGQTDPARAAACTAEALGLWRGRAYADIANEDFAQNEIARLEELRLDAEEERIEYELALGKSSELIADLEALVSAAPFRERRLGQLMLALYRSGRQADALALYQDGRRMLMDQLGLSPGLQLMQLHHVLGRAAPSEPIVPQSFGSAQDETPEFVVRLFDDWAFRIGRGEWPDPQDYLRPAGEHAESLRLLMDMYIRVVPRSAPEQHDIARARAWLFDRTGTSNSPPRQ